MFKIGTKTSRMKFVSTLSIQKQGSPNDGFLLNTVKTLFRLSRDLLKCILSGAIKFVPVRSP